PADSEGFGPKAANLAALAQAGLPTPGGTCIDAEAYRTQLAHLGLEASARRAASAELLWARRCALEVRLSLFEQPLAPPLVEPLLGACRALCGAPAAVRSSALVEDREGASFAGQFESYLGVDTEAGLLGGALVGASAALHGLARHRSFGDGDGDPRPATGRRARVRRGAEPHSLRGDAPQRCARPRFRDRARRGGPRSLPARPRWGPSQRRAGPDGSPR